VYPDSGTYDYNTRLQPVRIQLGTASNQAANSCLVYNYYVGVSNPTSCAIPTQGTSGNSGNEVGHDFQDTTNPSLATRRLIFELHPLLAQGA
jgi:hypothetical protein